MKRNILQSSSKNKIKKKSFQNDKIKDKQDDIISGMFANLNVYVLQSGLITKLRANIFKEQIRNHSGELSENFNDKTSLVVVEDSLDWFKFHRIAKWNDDKYAHIIVVHSEWLSKCLKDKRLHDTNPFELKPPAKPLTPSVKKSEGDQPDTSTSSSQLTKLKVSGFACSKTSSESVNHNKHITEKLEIMAETYKNTKDQWREYGYTKAISALKRYPREIKSYEEAKSLPGVGERLAQKIQEIIESGHFRKLEEVCDDDRIRATNLFAQIWGAGPSTAENWVQQGYRTLDDLRKKATLNKQQEIGLKHFHDFLEKMTREEAGEIIEIVKKAALSIQFGLEVVGCGSYRRGRALCGDIDILISHLKGDLQPHFLAKLIHKLHEIGLLTDNLTMPDLKNPYRSKFMGVCKLTGVNRKYRRIDLFVIPAEEYATALLAYTGSGHFNRSMRLLARKKGMALSDQALTTGVIRKGMEKIHGGRRLDTPTEESIFHHLGLEFRSPEERDV